MFIEEAGWLRDNILSLNTEALFPLLNIGSGTLEWRKNCQPHVYNLLFKDLEAKGDVVHLDIVEGEGVDIVGDLNDKDFLERLRKNKFKSIICSNLLEHVENKDRIANAIINILEPSGYLIASVPYRYPYHYAPVDNMYRPDIESLARLFHSTKLLKGEIVSSGLTYFDKLKNDRKLAGIVVLRSFLPFYKPKMWWNTVHYFPNLFRKFQTTCVILQKKPNEQK